MKEILTKRGQIQKKHTVYDSTYIKFKNRANFSIISELRIVFTYGGREHDWEGEGGGEMRLQCL